MVSAEANLAAVRMATVSEKRSTVAREPTMAYVDTLVDPSSARCAVRGARG